MGPQVVALVLDNSVVVGWLVRNQATAYTRRVAERAHREELIVPALWEVEFANVMTVMWRRRTLERHQIEGILTRAVRLGLQIDRHPVSPHTLFALAERHGISGYDAAYLELADRRGVPLATSDTLLARAARAAGIALA